MTLEWLLIVGAIAGVAAGSVLAVQRVVDDSTDRPPRPEVRVVDAEIAAAEVAYEATQIVLGGGTYTQCAPTTDTPVPGGCGPCTEVAERFRDVVELRPGWVSPDSGPPLRYARCILERR